MEKDVNTEIDIKRIEKQVMSTLKDFQRETVERIDSLFRRRVKRVLVSDEVGLGKTLIARGTIAKFIRMRFDENDEFVKIVYICSNSAIAQQNLEKLRLTDEVSVEAAGTSRLSMQHLKIFQEESKGKADGRKKVQLIPLTPETSLNMGSKGGWKDERALICAMLELVDSLCDYKNELNTMLIYGVKRNSWQGCVQWYRAQIEQCNIQSHGKYVEYMQKAIKRKLRGLLGKELNKTLEAIRQKEQTDGFGDLIKRLRLAFAEISVERLQADLIIMDEFQRFRDLLHPKEGTETEILKKKFFEEHDNGLYMLLLSATPYKMYSTLDEIDENAEEEHYKEFMQVMGFLNGEDKAFSEIWHNYTVSLRLVKAKGAALIEAKRAAENAMYENVCRTERISESALSDMICAEDKAVDTKADMSAEDVKSYIAMQNIARIASIGRNTPIDFIKSSPYLMSFMQHYTIKDKIVSRFKEEPDMFDEVSDHDRKLLWISRADINDYRYIKSNNARLEHVRRIVFDKKENAAKLLWVPPSKPYYEARGVYKGVTGFSKTLVFSAWEMVPRMVSCILSYDAECKTVGALRAGKEKTGYYFSKNRYPSPRLSFTLNKEKKPESMAQTALLYPSRFLAKCYSPAECMSKGMNLTDIEKYVGEKIKEKLMSIPHNTQSEEVDNSWYYLAPLLLDSKADAERWFIEIKREPFGDKALKEHIITLEAAYKGKNPGRMPADLVTFLVDLAIASPAVCAYRTYRVYSKNFRCVLPTLLAQAFIKKMNTTEATAVVELATTEKVHRRALLEYSKNGNIQAMMDEYVHILVGGSDMTGEALIERANRKFIDSMEITAATYRVESAASFKNKIIGKKVKSSEGEDDGDLRMRTHFAVSFTRGVNDEKGQNRKIAVREAFNSPFRPFVLTSTSIGQEGLDFHNYCRRIVHWNLPSNPIDIEQREGRINRFECYAIRQNVAKRYGSEELKTENVWKELFEIAEEKENPGRGSELIPHWGLTESEDMIKIERIVPAYPYSKDIAQYERLIKILSLYRLSLGQPRQEELLEYVFKNIEKPEELRKLFINLSPFYRKEVKKIEEDTD